MCVFAPVFWLPRELLGYVSYRDTYLCFGFEVFFGLDWFFFGFCFPVGSFLLPPSHLYWFFKLLEDSSSGSEKAD